MIHIRPADARGHSRTDPVHFLQIWLIPNQTGVAPAYDQRNFPAEERRRQLRLMVSPDGRDGSIATHQDALLYGALLDAGETATFAMPAGRTAYLQMARGKLEVNGKSLLAGDGATFIEEQEVRPA